MLQEINILTLFPDFFKALNNYSIITRAIKNKKIKINIYNFRDFSNNKHFKVDDYKYGHQAGMVLACQPIVNCLENKCQNSYKILLTPKGKTFNQQLSHNLVLKHKSITLICGHYEGFDARIANFVDLTISLGDFITSGGESVALVIVDSVVRLLKDVINPKSLLNESFSKNNISADFYTKPAIYKGYKVPEILVKGDHREINKWIKQSELKNKNLKNK